MVGLAIPARLFRQRSWGTRGHAGTGHERRRDARHEGAVPAPAQRRAMAAEGHRRHQGTPEAGRRDRRALDGGGFYQPIVRLASMRYHVYLEAEPTLESYRLSHQPRPGYGPVFICPFVVLTDSAATWKL